LDLFESPVFVNSSMAVPNMDLLQPEKYGINSVRTE